MATTKTGVTAVSTTEKKTPGESGGHKAQPTEQGDASSKIKVETEEKKKKIRVDLNKVPGERRDAQRRQSKEKLGTNNDEVKTALKSRNSKDTPVTNDVMPVDLLSEIPTPPEIKLPNSQVKTDNHVDESKTGVVSFSFKKIGAKISTVGVFGDMGANRKSVLPNHDGKSEPVEGDAASPTKSLLSAFIKVSSKEDIPLDWPEEMIQYTNTEPKISFSCNPLCFDFTQLLTRNKKVDGVIHEETKEGKAAAPKTELLVSEQNDKEEESDIKESVLHTGDIPQTEEQIVIAEREAVLKQVESGVSLEVEGKEVVEKIVKKKRKRSKHKKHHPDGLQDEKKKHSKKKKKKKKHKQNKTDLDKKETGDSLVVGKKMENLEDYDGDLEGEDVDKSKSRGKKKKKSKKSKRKKKRKHTSPHPSVEEKEAPEKNKKSRKSLNSVKSSKTDDHSSTNGSDNESKKDSNKRKKKKRKHRHDERSSEKDSRQLPNSSNCIAVAEMEFAGDLVVEKLPAVVKESNENEKIKSPVNNNLVKGVDTEKHSSSVRKRQTSESSVPGTPSSAKKLKLTPKRKIEEIKTVREKSDVDEPSNVSDVPEDSWSKMEEIYEGKEPAEMQKSKWDTSDSESENVLDKLMSSKSSVSSIKTESVSKNLCTVSGSSGVTINKSVQNVGPPTKTTHSAQDNSDPGNSVPNNPDSNSTNPSVSSSNAGDAHSASRVESSKSSLAENASPKKSSSLTRSRSRKISTHSRSASSDSSGSQTDDSYHSRRKRRRSYSKDSYRSHSSHRSYSSSSYSHSSHSRSRSYSRSRSRSHSRRSRSRSYSSYSESDRSSRSRSRSSRRHYSRSSRSRSRSYSSRRRSSYSSYSSRSRSRSRSRTSRSKKRRRSRRSRSRHSVRSSRSPSINGRVSRSKNKREKKTNASPLDIPLPNLDKEETVAPQKLLQKIKEKKQQHSDLVKKGISNAKKSDKNEKKEGYIDIPLPTLTDNLKDAEPCDQNVPVPPGFPVHPPPPPPGYNPDPSSMDHQCRPGGMMAPPPPPPPGHGNMHPPHRMPHMGGPRPYMGPPGPGPGPRFFPPPHHRMRPPNRMGPPPMHNPPGRPPFPRNQYPMRPPMRHPPPPHMLNCGPPPNQQDYQMKPNHIPEVEEGPPPLPPPKSPSPQPPPLPKEEEKKTEEPTQNPSIVIPPEQAEQYRRLQEQAQKHAKRQLRKQKQEKGEAISDSSSEEEDDVDELSNPTLEEEAIMEQLTPTLVSVPVSHPLALQQPTLMLAQPQPSASPLGGLTMSPHLVQASPQPQILIPTSGGAHFSLPHGLALPSYSHPSLSHAVTLSQSVPFQTGQPIIAVPGNALAAAGAQPAHLGALPTQFHLPGMHPAGFPISAASHPLLAHSPFMASQIPGGIPLSSPFQQTMLTQGAIPGSPYGAAGLPQGLIGHHLLGGLGGLGGGQVIRIIRPHL